MLGSVFTLFRLASFGWAVFAPDLVVDLGEGTDGVILATTFAV